jgi:hypothetical protein
MEYYATLLSIEVTILGIIAASIFVLLQMLHSNYSYKDMLMSLRGSSLFAFSVTSILVTLFTAAGLLHYAMGYHDLIPRWNLGVITVFQNDYVLTATMFAFLASITFGIVTIFANIKLLNPTTLIGKHLDCFEVSSVENFLLRKYGVTEPVMPILMKIKFVGKKDGDEETVDMVDEAKAKATYEEQLGEYEEKKRKASEGADLFQPFENLFIKTIAQGDRKTFQTSLADYEAKITSIIESADNTFPYQYLSQYLGESLNLYIETCRRNDLNTLALDLVRSIKRITIALSKNTNSYEVKELLKILKENADSAINNEDRLLFREIIKSYQEIGDSALETENHAQDGYSSIIDEVFRHLGWLAERLITTKGIEQKPMMHDDDYEDEFGILYNTLFHFDHKYSYDHADAYPLIFFDAVMVLFERMLDYYSSLGKYEELSEQRRPEIKDWLWSCGYVFASFGEKALEKGNGDGVSLSAIRLREVYRKANNTKNYKLAKDFIELIVQFAVKCGSSTKELKGKTLGSTKIPESLEEIILESPYRQEIRTAVFDSYIKVHGDDSVKKLDYIKYLSKKMNDDFGLNLQ